MKKMRLMELANIALQEAGGDTSWIKDPQVKSKVDMVIKTLGNLTGPDETVDGETLQFIIEALGMDEQMKKQLSGSKFDGDLETDYASESVINESTSLQLSPEEHGKLKYILEQKLNDWKDSPGFWADNIVIVKSILNKMK